MKIAIPCENGEVMQHFGHATEFTVYTIEDIKPIEKETVTFDDTDHEKVAGGLKSRGVDLVICGNIGEGAHMENEVNGIHVAEDIIEAFAGLDREQGEALGLEVSMQMAREALPYADGFYLMTPFNRVALMERLIARLRTELLDAEG